MLRFLNVIHFPNFSIFNNASSSTTALSSLIASAAASSSQTSSPPLSLSSPSYCVNHCFIFAFSGFHLAVSKLQRLTAIRFQFGFLDPFT
ncbi:hypothetical protein A2U01_0052867 [Trifolium medium]|uniref:Uncharacterized protein n=1 Tax=Trifolium medium TaxID=97028 RepID=A0A392R7Y0_9FABA|nr:hypothetical protein [Trifolium medium]